jgi:hypothetical protein
VGGLLTPAVFPLTVYVIIRFETAGEHATQCLIMT